MRSQVLDHSCLLICVPASHSRMHSALASATAFLVLAALAAAEAPGLAGAGAMEPVWASATLALKSWALEARTLDSSTADATMTRMDFPRSRPCSLGAQHDW